MKVVLGDVAVVVRDAKASARWWKEKCGFEVRDDAGHWVTVAPPGANVVIHLCQDEFPAESGNTGIGFFVDDVAAVQRAWEKRGVTFSVPRFQGSASVQARFLDPDGNEYWLFEDEDLRSSSKGAKKAKGAKAEGAKEAKGAKRRSASGKKSARTKKAGKRSAKKTSRKKRSR